MALEKNIDLSFLQIMRQFQAMSKGTEARDFNLIVGNASYVQTWSIIQCCIVIICTIVQVEVQISELITQ